ncbi:ras-related protein Rab-43 [Culicoides brevitarsis]|uniref:ras-related protein Rab-43 n=1 Tax=Culicoides brevitarsis TaxID=469753 RepID=UPI00307BFE60
MNQKPLTIASLNQTDDSFDFLFKVVLIGDCGTGKTCIVQRFKNGNWIEKHNNTIGVDFSIKTIAVDGKRVKLQIWDTAGQERFRTITQSYYRSANGVIIVYDITKRQSYVNLQRWIDEVRRYTASNVILALVGNKCDLEAERQVDPAEVTSMCELIPEIMFSIETSAKDNTNIENVFQNLAKELKMRNDKTPADGAENGIRLGEGRSIGGNSKCGNFCGSGGKSRNQQENNSPSSS